MRKNIWNKRIPTLFGLTLIIVGITVTTYLVRTGVIVVGQASPQENPQNIRITNVSNSSFSVSFKTEEPTVSSVSYGTTATFGNVAVDDINQNQSTLTPSTIHHITVKNLLPSTKYMYAITSGNSNYLNNDKPFEITTGPSLPSEGQQEKTISGSVVSSEGNAITEGLVYVKTDSSQTLSGQIQDGSYSLSLKSLRTSDLKDYTTLTDSIVDLLVITSTSRSEAKVLIEETDSVPTMTLGNTYDFTTSATPSGDLLDETASDSSSLIFPGFSATETKGPQITTPKKDERFVDQKPIFRGTTTPAKNAKITINTATPITADVKADSRGNWSFRPATNLAPGSYTITVETPDEFGSLRRLTQSFTVFAQGSQVDESATPSATPTKSPATPTPTTIPTLAPSATPIPTNTPIPTPTPTIFVEPTIPPNIPPVTPVPPGNISQTIMGFVAFAITSIGFLLFFAGSL